MVILPSDYEQLEYLRSTGTQQIDAPAVYVTGANQTYKAIVDCSVQSVSGNGGVFSICGDWQGFFMGVKSPNLIKLDMNDVASPSLTSWARKTYTLQVTNYGKNSSLSDGNSTIEYIRSTSPTNPNPIRLFAYSSFRRSSCTIYSFKVYVDNTIVRDFVPARRKSDGILGVYDTVNDAFYTNIGTGTFIAGPVVYDYHNMEDVYRLSNTRTLAGLPTGYTELEYLESTGTQWIKINYALDVTKSNKVEIDVLARPSTTDTGLFTYATNYAGWFIRQYDGHYGFLDDEVLTADASQRTTLQFTVATGGLVTSLTDGDSTTTHTRTTTPPSSVRGIMLFRYQTAYGKYAIYNFKRYEYNVLVQNLIPARREADNVLGMYDIVTGSFYTNAGTGTFTAGPAIEVKNIKDTDGTTVLWRRAVPHLGNPFTGTRTTTIPSIVAEGVCSQSGTPTPTSPVPIMTNCGEIKWNSSTQQIYYDGTCSLTLADAGSQYTQTANFSPLLACGDIKDTQDLISGLITHKIGVKVFDGTESFDKSSTYGSAFYIGNAAVNWGAQKALIMCSHYLGLAVTNLPAEVGTCFFNTSGHFYFRVDDNSDTAAFKSWLAAQYAAGTPVIVIYPLATPTTETVTAQPLLEYRNLEMEAFIEPSSNPEPTLTITSLGEG